MPVWSPSKRLLIRSCVMGRGVETFSISRAIAFASYTPTQMGSTVVLPTSFRMTMGILVTGSIMSPRIFISTSMRSLPFLIPLHHSSGTDTCHALADQRVGTCARHQHIQITTHQGIFVLRPASMSISKIESSILRRTPDPLAERLVPPLHVYLLNLTDQCRIAANLNGALPFVQSYNAAGLLFIGNVVAHSERCGIRPRRIFEREQRIVLHLIQQFKRRFEILLRFAREPDNDIRRDGDRPAGILHPFDAPHVLVTGIEALHRAQHACRS